MLHGEELVVEAKLVTTVRLDGEVVMVIEERVELLDPAAQEFGWGSQPRLLATAYDDV